ncbi:hypothetical protein RRG08_037357 [Elysia crispata]|uniref:G-protein coupled receptors family 1 profile domain-containing protein n=1 Tax=Elysia crispata TaxID=231223 RepID=A0AAE1AAE8_9GAST|nr:hypothetical protein RRG08_037357 [Elysia crispata]
MDISTLSPSLEENGQPPSALIDDVTFYYLTLGLRVILNPILAGLAFCAACINVVTFARMGLSRGINRNLFILSVSDLSLAAVTVVGNCCYVMLWLGMKDQGIYKTLRVTLWLVNYPNITSTVVTTVIAVVRCLCVVVPLDFRKFLTDRRQMIIIAFFCGVGYSVILYASLVLSVLQTSMKESKNASTLFDLFRGSFFYIALIINILSMVFLTVALKKSAKFRSVAASGMVSQWNSSVRNETRVIKTLILVLVIYVSCNLPLVLLSVLRLTLPGFTGTGQYRNLKGLVDMLIAFTLPFNIGLNLFVYITYNSRFRITVKSFTCYTPCRNLK